MAARFNVRFLLILIIVLGTLAGIVGGLALFVFKKDAAHFIAEGDTLRAEGEFIQARSQYRRALGEEPRNREALEKVEAMLAEYRPTSRSEAQSALTEVLSVAKHRVTHFPNEADGHLAMIRSLHEAAVLMRGLNGLWDRQGDSATLDFELAARSSSDEGFSYAELYRGMWYVYPLVNVAAERDDEERGDGITRLANSVAAHPTRDLDNAVWLRVLAGLDDLGNIGLSEREIDELPVPLDLAAAIASAEQNVVDGIQTQLELVRIRTRQAGLASTEVDRLRTAAASDGLAPAFDADGNPVSPLDVAQETLDLAIAARTESTRTLHDLLDSFVKNQSDHPEFPRIVFEVSSLLGRIGAFDRSLSPGPIIDQVMQTERWSGDARLMLAEAFVRSALTKGLVEAEDLERAYDVGERLATLPDQPAGLPAMLQRPLSLTGRIIQLDAAFARWDRAQGPDRITVAADVQKARDAVIDAARTLGIAEDSNDPQIMRARGLAEFAVDNRPGAARTLTALLDDSAAAFEPGDRAQLRLLLAMCLEDQGAIAPAAQSLQLAVTEQPSAYPLHLLLGRLRVRLGEISAARQSLNMARQFGAPPAMLNDLGDRIAFATGGESNDPAVQRVRDAVSLRDAGDLDGAIAALVSAREEFPDAIGLHVMLARMATASGDVDLAVASYEQAIRLDPNNPNFPAMIVRLTTADPVERVVATLKEAISDPIELPIRIVVAMDRQITARERELERSSDPERRTELEEEIARFRASINEWTLEANRRLAEADDPPYEAMTLWANRRLERALISQEWASATEIVAEIREADLDRADGAMAEGLLNVYRASSLTGSERELSLRDAVQMLTLATERLPFSWRAWDALGDALRLQGDFDGATLAYGRAYEADPTDRALAYRYIDSLERTGNRARATAVAREASARTPDDRFTRSLWLDLERRSGNDSTVLLERRAAYRATPADDDNAMKYALALVGTRPDITTLVDENGAPKVSNVRWGQMSDQLRQATLDEERRLWVAEAESITQSLEPESPVGMDGLSWGLLRAELDRAQGRPEDGVAALRAVYEAQTVTEVRMAGLAILTVYLNEVRRPAEAIDILRAARSTVPPERADPWWLEATLLSSLGQSEPTIAVLQELLPRVSATPSIVATADLDGLSVRQEVLQPSRVERQLVQAMIGAGQLDRAREQWDESFADSTSITDRLLGAAIDVRRIDNALGAGDPASAAAIEADLEAEMGALTTELPNDQRGWALRVELLIRKAARTGDASLYAEADDVLREARRTAPGAGPLDGLAIRVLEGLGDSGRLVQELERQLEFDPGDDRVRRSLADVLADADRIEDAIDVINGGIDFHGRRRESLAWRNRLGELFEQRGEFERAARAFSEGWELSGKEEPALLVGMARTMLNLTPPEYSRIINVLRDRDEDMNERPTLRTIYARALTGAGRGDDALVQYGQAYRRIRGMIDAGLTPEPAIVRWVSSLQDAAGRSGMSDVDGFTRQMAGEAIGPWELAALANGWFGTGSAGLERAVTTMREAVSKVPADQPETATQLSLQLAGYLMEGGRPDAALQVFESRLQVAPDDPTLLNNVAFLRATVMDDPEGALPLAERAVALSPTNWAMLDTAGKIYAQLERWEEAEAMLRRSLDLSERGQNMFHLAEVMVGMERWDDAMRRLERAAELAEPDDAELRGQINVLTDTVRARMTGG